MSVITKAVFPVAGLGTRFLPAAKASPKEMLPIVDKPLIQYAAEEALSAGITHLIFITGRTKRSIEDHFDKAYELEAELERKNKTALLECIRDILPSNASCAYIRQAEALGLGHAVLCAKPAVGNEPFAVLLADDLFDATPTVLQQMMEVYNQQSHSVLAIQNVPREQTDRYGVIRAEPTGAGVYKVHGLVEKPTPKQAPSTLAIAGRYILTPHIFSCLEHIGRGAGSEYQLTDAIAALLEHEPVFGHEFTGKRYDCGSKFGYLQATVEYALRHPELKDSFREYLKNLEL